MTDRELLQSYVAAGSQDAFAELARRYINLVYASALRQTRDGNQADDITQAVFIIFARKAKTIRDPALLAPWLIGTTRFAALNARRLESSRRHHETQAAAMNLTASDATQTPDIAAQIAPLLDQSLAALGAKDRAALVLRYLRGKSLREVGLDLKMSEDTTRKRVSRALVKLRSVLARAGIQTADDAIATALEQQSLQCAPAGLIASVLTGSLTATAASASTSLLANATLKAMTWIHTKVIASACAASILLVAGTTAAVLQIQSRTQAATPSAVASPLAAITTAAVVAAPTTAPADSAIKIPNTSFSATGGVNLQFQNDRDDTNLHNGVAPLHLKALSPDAQQAVRRFSAPVDKTRGFRIRLSAWTKSQDVAKQSGVMLAVLDEGGRILGIDSMQDRPVIGTTDWTLRQLVMDVPKNASKMIIQGYLTGTGEIWIDDCRIELVGKNIPTTDDLGWKLWGPNLPVSSVGLDPQNPRNGHPTTLIQAPNDKAGKWCWYGQGFLPDKYVGKQIRMTVWMKSEGLTGGCGPTLTVKDNAGGIVARDPQLGHRPVKGTLGWLRYSVTCSVPAKGATYIAAGVVLNGSGKLWFDQDDVKYELIDAPATGAARTAK